MNELTRRVGSTRRLGIGAVLLAVGGAVAGVGIASVVASGAEAVGVADATSLKLGVVVGAALLPAVSIGLFRFVPAADRFRTTAAVGLGLAALGIAAFWAMVSTASVGAPSARWLVPVAVYAAGSAAILASLLTAATIHVRAGRSPGSAVGVAVRPRGSSLARRPRADRARRSLPTDGGEADDELRFPLDGDRDGPRRASDGDGDVGQE